MNRSIAFALTALIMTPPAMGGDKPVTQEVKKAEGAVLAPQVSLEELKKIVASKSAVIIDANGKQMYEDGHLPRAISYAAHEGNLASVLPKDKNTEIVAYCGGKMCSAWEAAASEAKKAGYTNIKHFKDGIKGWKEAGLPVEKVTKKS